jgi:tetratricopeptide (TPR) repeat protein
MSPAEAFPRAKAAARKALEIDDSLAPAHASLGLALSNYDHDWNAAESESKRAIALDPNYATGRFWYSLLLLRLGNFDEALDQIQKAREIDPFSPIIQSNAIRALVFARRFDRAIEEGRKVSKGIPNFGPAHFFLAAAYEAAGMRGEAAAEFRKASDLLGPTPQGIFQRGSAEALEGRRAEALRTIQELQAMAASRYVSPSYLGQIFLRLGEKDRALEWLDRAFDDHSYEVIFLNVDPLYDGLRADPRFQALLRKAEFAPRAP